jgi:hypothetical protein
MPELTQLHELSQQVRTPELEDLAALAERRRRRARAGVLAGVAGSVALAAVIAVGVSGDRTATSDPAPPGPSPSPTVTFPALSAQQIRQHPDAYFSGDGDFPSTASKARARVWSVCLDDCSRETEWLPGEEQSAIEVSTDDFETGSVYSLDGSEYVAHVVDDWYLIETGMGPTLVDARGQRRLVRFGAAVPMADVTGPLTYSRRGLAYVDVTAGTLHVIEGGSGWWWQGAGDSWFWGTATLAPNTTVRQVAAVWRLPDGTFGATVLPIGPSDGGPGMLSGGVPGTMAVVEHFTQPRVAHISTDYGATWQVRLVPDGVDSGGDLPDDWPTWPSG